MIKEIMNMKNGNKAPSGKFQISQIGGCKRKAYLELKGLYKEDYSPKQLRIFDIGNYFHKFVVRTLLEKERLSGIHVVASEVYINEHPFISGRADIIVSDGKDLMLIDTKSVSDFVIHGVKNNSLTDNTVKTFEKYRKQVLLYLHFFNIKKGYILLMGKGGSGVEEIEVDYDKEEAEALEKEIKDFFDNYVNKNIEPPKCDGGEYGCGCCHPEMVWNND